jgi:hypothetical protein
MSVRKNVVTEAQYSTVAHGRVQSMHWLGYALEDPWIAVRFQAVTEIALSITATRPAVGLHQPLIQWVKGDSFPERRATEG